LFPDEASGFLLTVMFDGLSLESTLVLVSSHQLKRVSQKRLHFIQLLPQEVMSCDQGGLGWRSQS